MEDTYSRALVRWGVRFLVLSPIAALMGALGLVAVPGLAVATHVTMIVAGVTLLGVALLAPRVRLRGWAKAPVFYLLTGATTVAALTGLLAALMGAGGSTLTALTDVTGSASAEGAVRLGVGLAGLAMLGALALVLDGLITPVEAIQGEASGRRPEHEPDRSVKERNASRLTVGGVGLLVLALLIAMLGGFTPLPSLPVVTPVGLCIFGLLFLSLGLYWPRLELGERQQDVVVAFLAAGAAGTLVTGVLANVLDAGGLALAGAYTGLFRTHAGESVTQAVALLTTVLAAIGIALAWHGLPRAKEEPGGARSLPAVKFVSARLARLGVWLALLGFAAALLTSLARLPRVGVGTAATLMIIGPMFICFGLVWPDHVAKREVAERHRGLDDRRQRSALRYLTLGAYGILISGMVLALLGIGGDTLSVSAAGHVGPPNAELAAKIAVDLSALLMFIGLVLVWLGSREPNPAPSGLHRVAGVAWVIIGILVVQAAIFHMLPNVLFGDVYPLRLVDYDYGREGGPVTLLWAHDAERERDYRTAQGWTPDEWQWFYHASQGGAFELPIPYDWITALEQPTVHPWPPREVPLLMDPDHLVRFGFLPNERVWYDTLGIQFARHDSLRRHSRIGQHRANNPEGLPVGLARTDDWVDHASGTAYDAMGFTCAACHTGQVDWLDTSSAGTTLVRVRIEGGPATVDLGKFRSAVGMSLALTELLPGRFDRFVQRVHEATVAEAVHVRLSQALSRDGMPDSLRYALTMKMTDVLHDRRARRALATAALRLDVFLGEPVDTVRSWPTDSMAVLVARRGGRPGRWRGGEAATAARAEALADTLARRIAARSGMDSARVADDVRSVTAALDSLDAVRRRGMARGEQEVLRERFEALLERGRTNRSLQDSLGVYPTEEGYSRLDATGRAANYLLGSVLAVEENLQVANGPVNFPHIWDAPWFEWVQYNASFQQPMMRNAAEGLGVFAAVDLRGSGRDVPADEDPLLFASGMDVITIYEMEKLLSGERVLGGLQSPTWPTRFPEIDLARRTQGEDLYRRYCARCHLPASTESSFFDDAYWTARDSAGRRYLRLEVKDLAEIGTDPLTAMNFRNRRVALGDLARKLGVPRRIEYKDALRVLVQAVKERRYEAYGIATGSQPGTQRSPLADELDGYRSDATEARLGYRARPLNGIWATPPFLHNGSVPTLYQLLSPQAERPDRFFLGSRLFDPDSIGFDYGETPGGFEFDTSLPGNSNRGHLFEGDTASWRAQGRVGVVGPRLEPNERLAIIEFLKWLPPLSASRSEPGPGG